MNDWSRLAVDPRRCKNSRPKTNCTNTYTLPTGVQRARALFGIVELTRPPSGGSQGQLRLSLTNTYHEWPVINADSLICQVCRIRSVRERALYLNAHVPLCPVAGVLRPS